MSRRAEALASRVIQGAEALATYADGLDDAQWRTAIPGDGGSVGVVVHRVASVYPIEVQLAQTLASGSPIAGVTWAAIAEMNAKHATDNVDVGRRQPSSCFERTQQSPLLRSVASRTSSSTRRRRCL